MLMSQARRGMLLSLTLLPILVGCSKPPAQVVSSSTQQRDYHVTLEDLNPPETDPVYARVLIPLGDGEVSPRPTVTWVDEERVLFVWPHNSVVLPEGEHKFTPWDCGAESAAGSDRFTHHEHLRRVGDTLWATCGSEFRSVAWDGERAVWTPTDEGPPGWSIENGVVVCSDWKWVAEEPEAIRLVSPRDGDSLYRIQGIETPELPASRGIRIQRIDESGRSLWSQDLADGWGSEEYLCESPDGATVALVPGRMSACIGSTPIFMGADFAQTSDEWLGPKFDGWLDPCPRGGMAWTSDGDAIFWTPLVLTDKAPDLAWHGLVRWSASTHTAVGLPWAQGGHAPRLSPDGSRLAFARQVEGGLEFVLADLDGAPELALLELAERPAAEADSMDPQTVARTPYWLGS